MLEERRPVPFDVGRVKLDARKRCPGLEACEVVLPLRCHVWPQRLQVKAAANRRGRRGPPARADEELFAGTNDQPRESHHRALVCGIEEPKGVDCVPEPFSPRGRIGAGREDVENAATEGELARFLDEGLTRIAKLDQARGDTHRVRT